MADTDHNKIIFRQESSSSSTYHPTVIDEEQNPINYTAASGDNPAKCYINKVPNADSAGTVTTKIGDKNISAILRSDGITARMAQKIQDDTNTSVGFTWREIKHIIAGCIYPIGSLFITTTYYENSNAVKTALGFMLENTIAFELIDANQTLWTTKTEGEGGDSIDAGLPNITGTFRYDLIDSSYPSVSKSFYVVSSGSGIGMQNDGNGYTIIRFDASRSSKIYGNSDTVQPPAIKVYIWKRTA